MMSVKVTVTKRSGHLTCGICGARAIRGIFAFGFFCSRQECANSEELFTNE